MSASDIRNFIYENHYKQIAFSKEDSYLSLNRLKKKQHLLLFANKLIEKILDPRNAKQHYAYVTTPQS